MDGEVVRKPPYFSDFICTFCVFVMFSCKTLLVFFFSYKRAGAGRYEMSTLDHGRYEMSTLDHGLRMDCIYYMVVVKSIALD